MSDEEVDELLKAVDTSSGELNYMGTYILCARKAALLGAMNFASQLVLTRLLADMVKTILAN